MALTKPVEAGRRYFTVDEANRTLPLVRAIVADIVRQWQTVVELKGRLAPVLGDPRRRGRGDAYSEELEHRQAELEAQQDALRAYFEELEKLGVELKSPAEGLCDFPGQVDGREVCLCWKHGEADVQYWHEVDAGFSGRQPIATLRSPRAPRRIR